MNFSGILSALLILVLICTFRAHAQESAHAVPHQPTEQETQDGYKIVGGFADDDFLLETQINTLIGRRVFPARDDHVSGSLYFTALYSDSVRSYLAALAYHTLTDRATLFRSDLLAFSVALEREATPVRYQAGIGAYLLGDLGGESLQNGFHDFFGYRKVSLNYGERTRGGVTFSGRIEYPSVSMNERNTILPFVSLTYSTGSLLNSCSVGVSENGESGILRFDVTGGYVLRYGIAPPLERIFGSALYYGILAEAALGKTWSVSGWVTRGQFGDAAEYHFGASIGWKVGEIRPMRLKDISFP